MRDVLEIKCSNNYAKLSVRKECHWTRVGKVLHSTACCRLVVWVVEELQQAVLPLRPQPVHDVGNEVQSSASASKAVLGLTNAVEPRARPSNCTYAPRRRDGFLFFRTVFFSLVVEGSVSFLRGECSARVFIFTCATCRRTYSLANLPYLSKMMYTYC